MQDIMEGNSKMGKCDVCGKEDANSVVMASKYGPVSLCYCHECAANGYEPYNIIVAYISCVVRNGLEDLKNEAYREDIKKQLKFLGKTEAEFNADCAKLYDLE